MKTKMKGICIAMAMAGAGTEGVAKITIDGEIGGSWWDDTAVISSEFMREIKALGDLTEIQIDMNSPGGSVTDGLTIANYLRQHDAKVVVNVLGQASSIASVIAAAADEVNMGLGAFMMVHQPWTAVVGNADQMRAMAMDLDTINSGMLEAYVAKVGEDSREEMASLIKGTDGDGTILSAEMAVELGLADSMLETRAAASVSSLTKAMARAAVEAQALLANEASAEGIPMTALDALALAFDMEASEAEGQTEQLAEMIMALRQKATDLEAQVAGMDVTILTIESLMADSPDLYAAVVASADHAGAVDAAMAAERGRVGSILKACQTTGHFKDLEKLVNENWEASKASDYILGMAASSGQHIQGSHSPEGGQISGLDSSKIYARRNSKVAT